MADGPSPVGGLPSALAQRIWLRTPERLLRLFWLSQVGRSAVGRRKRLVDG